MYSPSCRFYMNKKLYDFSLDEDIVNWLIDRVL